MPLHHVVNEVSLLFSLPPVAGPGSRGISIDDIEEEGEGEDSERSGTTFVSCAVAVCADRGCHA